jgi:hypothetical protein
MLQRGANPSGVAALKPPSTYRVSFGGFRRSGTVHRPLKKTAFWAIFAFDLPRPRTYNPRPRCFAAKASKWCYSLNSDVKTVATALFDIVISGRGTWAAARYATRVKGQTLTQTNRAATFECSRSSARQKLSNVRSAQVGQTQSQFSFANNANTRAFSVVCL